MTIACFFRGHVIAGIAYAPHPICIRCGKTLKEIRGEQNSN